YIDDVSGIGFSAQLTELKETQKNNLIHSSLHNLSNLITNRLAQIVFSLANPSQVSLKIYDTKGKLIKNLVDGLMSSGVHNVSWDGTDEHRHKVAEGIYFYTLETPSQNFCRKMVLIQN
ncbi:MAG: T9SS type A sorting domain-containing protein, partial [candidate division WOR-3 bacterium]|nr:T9SS type A sorting domain-containing protein [candidate division WOR-3 bacterium]